MQSNENSLTRLIDGVDNAVATGVCGYYRRLGVERCIECPAEEAESCGDAMLEDIARRLHALMPHDMDGREIKVGDTIKNAISLQMHVTDVMPLPVSVRNDTTSHVTTGVPHLWRVVEPDSWERLEQDATLLPHDYLTTKDASDKRCGVVAMTAMAADLVRRAKKLAGVE